MVSPGEESSVVFGSSGEGASSVADGDMLGGFSARSVAGRNKEQDENTNKTSIAANKHKHLFIYTASPLEIVYKIYYNDTTSTIAMQDFQRYSSMWFGR